MMKVQGRRMSHLLLIILLFHISCAFDYNTLSQLDLSVIPIEQCPHVSPDIYKDCSPRGNQSAGRYEAPLIVQSTEECVNYCCENEMCNVVFLFENKCFQIDCVNDTMCEPEKRSSPKFQKAQMVLVRPVLQARPISKTCEYGLDYDCSLNEECHPVNAKSKNGICTCKQGFRRDKDQMCVPFNNSFNDGNHASLNKLPMPSVDVDVDQNSDIQTQQTSHNSKITTTSSPTTTTMGHLVVKVVSKEIQLPENEAVLSAFTIPAATEGEPYEYEWKIITRPEGEKGIMQDQNTDKLKLKELVEGLYAFKVTVTTPNAMGEAKANVTVLPPKRHNKAPVARVNPPSQIVTLPNNKAVLDASSSTDDTKIISYHWELQQGPMGYQPALDDTALLEVSDLIPGNYTFKLTVEDEDHTVNSTTANVNVTKEPDYPPKANAGETVIVYLPQTILTLNGNKSSDDKGITSWEWTLSSENNKAVDMQNTHTPYLQLSNLEQGVYTFTLKVADAAGQTATNDVHVFVKEPPNKPPEVSAGPNTTINLPQNWVLLDGSITKEEVMITTWHWEQVSGPNQAVLLTPDKSQTNATGLTKGEYKFKVTIVNQNQLNTSAVVKIRVTQSENSPPKARAGGEQTVVLPFSVLFVNGSLSTDDAGIVQWEWTRDSQSVAAGRIIAGSHNKPILMVTDLIPGIYIFNLKVTDEQGVSNSDTATIHVKTNPLLLDLIEIELNTRLSVLREVDKNTVLQQLALLLHEEGEVRVKLDQLKEEQKSGNAIIVFHVEKSPSSPKVEIMSGSKVLSRLKDKLHHDGGLLLFTALNLDTVVCQNPCSNHGVCDEATRECLCEAFWMENFIRRHLGDGERNCEWSILYVIIIVFTLIVALIAMVWGCVCVCRKCCERQKPKRRYSLLEDHEMVAQANLINTDSDSESDVLYESRKQSRSNGKANKGKNGFVSFSKRIKT